MKICILALTIALLFVTRSRGADFTFQTTKSPDGRYAISGDGSANAPKSMYFENMGTGVLAGWVIKPDQAGATHMQVIARWNDSSSRVALLVAYGAKGSDFKIFKKEGGQFLLVKFEEPDPLSLLQKEKPSVIPTLARPIAYTDSLGFWINNATIRLLHGIDLVFPGKDDQLTVYASFEVVVDSEAEVKNVQLFGPYSEAESTSFLERWAKGN